MTEEELKKLEQYKQYVDTYLEDKVPKENVIEMKLAFKRKFLLKSDKEFDMNSNMGMNIDETIKWIENLKRVASKWKKEEKDKLEANKFSAGIKLSGECIEYLDKATKETYPKINKLKKELQEQKDLVNKEIERLIKEGKGKKIRIDYDTEDEDNREFEEIKEMLEVEEITNIYGETEVEEVISNNVENSMLLPMEIKDVVVITNMQGAETNEGKENNIFEGEVIGDEFNEILAYLQKLKGSRFIIKDNELKELQKNGIAPVSNFVSMVTERINYHNGQDKDIYYKIKGFLLDELQWLEEIRISRDQYNSFNYIQGTNWENRAIICAGGGNKEKMKEVTQRLSRGSMIEKEVLTHMGWVRIGEELAYVFHGGIISVGKIENVAGDLTGDALEKYCMTDKEFDLKETLKMSKSVLDVADYKITIPLLATIYLSTLWSIFQEEEILADYILFINGKTGSLKSSITAIGLCHFGKFDRNSFKSGYRDTINTLEKKAFILKDTVMVIDDYDKKGGDKTKILEMLYGMYGDRFRSWTYEYRW